MKKLLLLILVTLWLAHARDITGKWNGRLKVQEMELTFVFDISRENSAYNVKMYSSEEKAFEVSISATNFKSLTLNIEAAKGGIQYQGKFELNGIEDSFYQSCQSFLLNLQKYLIEKMVVLNVVSGWLLNQTK